MADAEIISTTPCPKCIHSGNINVLKNRAGKFATYCDAGHEWPDTDEMKSALAMAKAKFPQHYGPAPRAPENPNPPPTPNLPGSLIIDPMTRGILEGMLGTKLASASDLKGAFWSLNTDLKNAREAATEAAKVRPIGSPAQPGQANGGDVVTIQLPEYALEGISEFAAAEGKSIPQWVQEQVGAYFDTYFAGSGARGR